MRPSEGACYLLLILVVAELLPGFSCSNNPRYDKFLTQHLDATKSNFGEEYCNNMMKKRKLTNPACKEVNTFIHCFKRQIRDVCDKGGEPYKNLRRSKNPFQVTTCKHMGGSRHWPCEYREDTSSRYIVIGCENGWPVHYDEGHIVITG